MNLNSNNILQRSRFLRPLFEADNLNTDILSLNTISNLNKAMADEWLAMYQYFTESFTIENTPYAPYIVKELKQHAMEEYHHANLLANRILELGGKIVTDPNQMLLQNTCGYTEPLNNNSFHIITDAINGEQCAIKTYTQMANDAKNIGDIITYDLLMKIVDDEIEHENDLRNLIQQYRLG